MVKRLVIVKKTRFLKPRGFFKAMSGIFPTFSNGGKPCSFFLNIYKYKSDQEISLYDCNDCRLCVCVCGGGGGGGN